MWPTEVYVNEAGMLVIQQHRSLVAISHEDIDTVIEYMQTLKHKTKPSGPRRTAEIKN